MANIPFQRLRVGLTLFVSLAIWSLLAWRHLHDGVPAHHLFHDPELPRVSDWFGGVLPTVFGSLMALATLVIHRFVGLPLERLTGLRAKPGLRGAG
jgi:hypothetical protein